MTDYANNKITIYKEGKQRQMKTIRNWQDIDWKKVYKKVQALQELLVEEHNKVNKKQSNIKRVYEIQRKLITSFEARALAVRKVHTNDGGKTPGIDGKTWKTPEDRFKAINKMLDIVKQPNNYKAQPLKRVEIPKPGGDKRKLGIPTITDRAVQYLYYLAIDPLVECTSDMDSYGFRKYRSAQDAINRLRTLLDKKHSPEWILETDIEKCFDKINHNFIMGHTPICDKNVLMEWLKSGVIVSGEFIETTEGTPQGGIISPMLCNLTLNGMEGFIKESITKKDISKVHIIRYADDIVITANKEEGLSEIKLKLEEFLKERGLKIKESKTCIRHINEGFDFLGWNFRKFPMSYKKNQGKNTRTDILIVKPSKKNYKKIINSIKEVLKKYKTLEVIISKLNPILRGWGEYFRISSHSASDFGKINSYVFKNVWKWLRHKYKYSTATELKKKYITSNDNYNWVFVNRSSDLKGKIKETMLFQIAGVKKILLSLIKLNINPYTSEGIEYYSKRKTLKLLNKSRGKLYKYYNNICEECGERLDNGEEIEIHHIKTKKEGGKDIYKNLKPLHKLCHQKITITTLNKSEIKK